MIWGALHGAHLCINHAWHNLGPKVGPRFEKIANLGAFILTFLCVVVAWAILIAIYAGIAWLAPNTQEIMGYDHKNRVR